MASLPLAGVKPCPRRWLIRAEQGRRGEGLLTVKTVGVERGGRCHSGRRGARLKSFENRGPSDSADVTLAHGAASTAKSWCHTKDSRHKGRIKSSVKILPHQLSHFAVRWLVFSADSRLL